MKLIIASLILLLLNSKGLEAIERKQQLANRFLVENILLEVFGQQVKSYTRKFIIPNISIFGGPCDIYEQVRKDQTSVSNIDGSCFGNKNNHKVELSANSNSLRAGFMLKTCKSIVNDLELMKHYYKKHKITTPNDFNLSSLETIHQDFFPYSKISKEQIKVLKRLFYATTSKKWNSIVLTYCISPKWHLL
ncbi:hypothetical protein [Halobacteriovorax sp. JY17]|uniref:hypothetical protein n=1 Tax=Halobacteriovorax sp. JY17 TaxID=2014617 RepID=UPI000C484520|nr:hypothetical protein [Halobacteriovorax sp. JY17]PIK15565.1 MAG: hypothetical protein CES88_02250 [Halobacteriovorax sp. JY17]